MRIVCCHPLANETKPNTYTMHVYIYPQTWLGLLTYELRNEVEKVAVE